MKAKLNKLLYFNKWNQNKNKTTTQQFLPPKSWHRALTTLPKAVGLAIKSDAETLYTFISRVDYVILLYQTNDVWQQIILLGVIETKLDGHVTWSLGLPNIEEFEPSYFEEQVRSVQIDKEPNHMLHIQMANRHRIHDKNYK